MSSNQVRMRKSAEGTTRQVGLASMSKMERRRKSGLEMGMKRKRNREV